MHMTHSLPGILTYVYLWGEGVGAGKEAGNGEFS